MLSQLLCNLDQYAEEALTPRVLYCFNSHPPDSLPANARTHCGVPPLSEVVALARAEPSALYVVLDDLVPEMCGLDSKTSSQFCSFTIDVSRKENVSLFVISQNIYVPGIFLKQFIRAATALVLFSYSQDHISLSRLLSQIFGGRKDYFYESFKHAMDLGFGKYIYVPLMRTYPEQNLVKNIRNFWSVPKDSGLSNAVFSASQSFFYEPKTEATSEALMPRQRAKKYEDEHLESRL